VAGADSIKAISRARNQIDGALFTAVRSFEARAEHRAEGHASVVPWLQHHCRLRKREARRIARLSRFAFHLEAAGKALGEGSVTFDHVEVLASAYKERFHGAWAEATPLLLAFAADARFEDFAREVQRFADALDPRAADDRFEDQLDGRNLAKGISIDGFAFVQAWMDPISYSIFDTEHERLTRELFELDWAAAKDELGRDPDANELAQLTRTPAQRSHDALVLMAERSRSLAGGKVAAAAAVVIHCTQDAYEAALARQFGDDTVQYPADGFCETEDGTVLSPIAAVYLSLIGEVRRIVFSAEGEILVYSRGRRCFTPAQAAAIRAKFRRCTHPYGCDRSGPLLQTDHVVEHQDGGPTDVANAEPMCESHNRWKTNQRGRPPPASRRDTDQRRAPPVIRQD
jgi:Domain of unknown function (DUF222)